MKFLRKLFHKIFRVRATLAFVVLALAVSYGFYTIQSERHDRRSLANEVFTKMCERQNTTNEFMALVLRESGRRVLLDSRRSEVQKKRTVVVVNSYLRRLYLLDCTSLPPKPEKRVPVPLLTYKKA